MGWFDQGVNLSKLLVARLTKGSHVQDNGAKAVACTYSVDLLWIK